MSLYRNPANDYVESASLPGLWCLLFGCFYFLAKGIWGHAIIAFLLAAPTLGLSWLIYPFFASGIVEKHYLRKGWIKEPSPPRRPLATMSTRLAIGIIAVLILAWIWLDHGADRTSGLAPSINTLSPEASPEAIPISIAFPPLPRPSPLRRSADPPPPGAKR
jgi:hypothetical protein